VTPRIVRWTISNPPGSRRERHVIAQRKVGSAADNLQRTVAGVNHHEAYPIRAVNSADLVDARDNNVLEAVAHRIDSLDHQAEVIKGWSQGCRRLRQVNELA
jgi:hypothetical protein